MTKRITRFIMAGAIGAVVNIGILYLATDIFGIYYLYSAIVSFILASLVSFTLQKVFTFEDRSTDTIHTQFSVFFAVSVFNLVFNTALLWFFVSVIGIWYILAQVIVSGLIAITSFLLYRRIFRDDLARTLK